MSIMHRNEVNEGFSILVVKETWVIEVIEPLVITAIMLIMDMVEVTLIITIEEWDNISKEAEVILEEVI